MRLYTPSNRKARIVIATKITEQQKVYLRAIEDWKAPFEVEAIVGLGPARLPLQRLVKLGWAQYGKPNNTYKITDAGRAALTSK